MPRAPATIDEYIRVFPPEVQAAAPGAKEAISYRMPAFFQDGALVYFAAFKKHIGFYPPVRDEKLKKALRPYAGPKGNLKFPMDRAMPFALIRRIVQSRLRENRQRATAKARK